jgi:hypothetical protein
MRGGAVDGSIASSVRLIAVEWERFHTSHSPRPPQVHALGPPLHQRRPHHRHRRRKLHPFAQPAGPLCPCACKTGKTYDDTNVQWTMA